MPGKRPMRDWIDGDPLSASHWQEGVEVARPLTEIWGEGATVVDQFPEGTAVFTPPFPQGPAVWRMIVKQNNVAPNLLLAKLFDGVNEIGPEVPVRVFFQRDVDRSIFVYAPGGGTDSVHNGQPVFLQEVYSLPDPQYQYEVVQAVAQGVIGLDFVHGHSRPG